MASTPVVNIVIPQGTDFSELFTSTESDGSASNLVGYTGAAKIKKHPGASTSTSFSVSIIGSTGEVTISLTDTQTTDLEPGRYYYDVYLTSGSGSVSRMVEGMAFVTAGITT
jgi:flagellar hook assembly protein FlgD